MTQLSPQQLLPIQKAIKGTGEEAWKRAEKVNGELFVLTYGAIVAQLCRDIEPSSAAAEGGDGMKHVNDELFRMGVNIGVRLIEDFLAKSGWPRCSSFAESVSVLSAIAFKMFLNCVPRVYTLTADLEYALVFGEDEQSQMPLVEFVQLPPLYSGLLYLNILPGLIRGAFAQIHFDVEAWIERDQLRGDGVTELRVKFNRLIEETLPPGE